MNILEQDLQMIKIDGKELSVTCRINLIELCQDRGSSSWRPNGNKSQAVCLANSTWLFRIPSKERGDYIWLKMNIKDKSSNLGAFYRGNSEAGPAKKFAMSGQTQEVSYELFDKKWTVRDIGAFSIEVISGSSEMLKSDDRIHFVTSKGESDWLLYLDSRHGEAKGTGGSLIGTEFKPEVDVESTL